MHNVLRALLSLAFAVALTAVPLVTVSACSCAMSEFREAIRSADVAIVGTAVASEPVGKGDMGEAVLTTWAVERSRDPIDGSRVEIGSWADSGANCGISFSADERWLVLAYAGDGGLETNGCMQNRRLDGSDPEAEAIIAEAITEEPSGVAPADPGLDVPTPLLAIAGVAVLVGAVSLMAFRRSAR